jgi:hypothetical protein
MTNMKTICTALALVTAVPAVGNAGTITLFCQGTSHSFYGAWDGKTSWSNTLTIDTDARTMRYSTFPPTSPSQPVTIGENEISWNYMSHDSILDVDTSNIGTVNRLTGQLFSRRYVPGGRHETEAMCSLATRKF